MGSQFIGGILSSGVEVELSKAIVDASKSYVNQMEEVGIFLDGESKAGLAQSNAVNTAEQALAQVDLDNANTNLYQGLTQIAGPITTIGMRAGRETGLNLLGGSELKQINEEADNVSAWQKTLRDSDPEIISGSKDIEMTEISTEGKKTNPLAAQDISDEEMDKLRHGKYAENSPENDERAASMEKLKALRASDNKGDTAKLGKLYDDVDKKLNKEEESVNNRRQRYNDTTDRWSGYMQSTSQAASSFAQYGGGLKSAADQKVRAQLDAVKTMTDYQTQSQKSAADMAVQGSQNSAQSITELARAKAEIAQANRM